MVNVSAVTKSRSSFHMPSSHAIEMKRQCFDSPSWELSPSQLADTEILLSGAFAPLEGFMTRDQAVHVMQGRCLPCGRYWPSPLVLEVDVAFANNLKIGELVALREPTGGIVAVLAVADIWFDPRVSSTQNVAFIGGALHALERARCYAYQPFWITPLQARRYAQMAGWRRTLALFVDKAWHDEAWGQVVSWLHSCEGGLLIFVAGGKPGVTRNEDVLLQRHWVQRAKSLGSRGKVINLPGNQQNYADVLGMAPIVAKNFGADAFMTCDPSLMADTDDMAELIRKELAFLGIEYVLSPKQAQLVVDLESNDISSKNVGRDVAMKGFTIFMTGLSGAGKSTLANALQARLWQIAVRPVTLLDGDLVRKHLSNELGFSREHRNTNVTRIGYVASEITKHGGIAICAPIAPYREARRAVRAMIAEYGAFIEVYVATPLAVCEARDPKGLYAKARAGELLHFTGVSDPYEIPERPEIVIDTTMMDPQTAVEQIIADLARRGLL